MNRPAKVLTTVVLTAGITCVFFFMPALIGRKILPAVAKISGLELSYSDLRGNPFRGRGIRAADFSLNRGGVGARSREAFFHIDPSGLFRKRRIIAQCYFEDVVFFLSGDDPGKVTNVMDLLSLPGQVFEKLSFSLTADRELVEIKSLMAVSEDIVVEGDVYWNRSRNAVSIDMAFSVSPELAAGAGSGIKERLLTSKEDGWFGTSIAYKGNPDFLKALYTAISPSGDR